MSSWDTKVHFYTTFVEVHNFHKSGPKVDTISLFSIQMEHFSIQNPASIDPMTLTNRALTTLPTTFFRVFGTFWVPRLLVPQPKGRGHG